MTDPEIEGLLSKLRTDDPPVDPDVLKDVVRELRNKDPHKFSEALAAALRDTDAEYRGTVASVFLRVDFATAMQHVPALLHDEDTGIQGFMCMELGAHRRLEAVPHLVGVLNSDPEGTHRVIAAWALGNIGDPAGLPALRQAMQTDAGVDYEGRAVKDIAAEAIRRITEEKTTACVA